MKPYDVLTFGDLCVDLIVSGGDSIGAGDSFDTGFLAGRLRGLGLERCLELGRACGRGAASQVGGLAGQPRRVSFDF